jgi:hypothetical protein
MDTPADLFPRPLRPCNLEVAALMVPETLTTHEDSSRANGARLFERATGPIFRQDSELSEFIQSFPERILTIPPGPFTSMRL